MKMKIIKNLIMFYIGASSYVFIEVIYRGYSFLPMAVCGGLAILLLDKINNRISWDMDILFQGCIGSLLITLMEFIIGYGSLIGVFPQMWDYSNVILNYKGIICVPFSLIWILLSILAIMLADAINYYVFKEEPLPYYKLFGKTIFKYKKFDMQSK